MNRQRYKLVFNRHRGQLMAVAEIASSVQHHGRTSAPGVGPADWLPSVLRFSRLAVTLALALNTVAHAQILGDRNAPRNQQPTVLVTPNGVPVVNIQTPSSAGVSMNQYRQFDVGANGVKAASLDNTASGSINAVDGLRIEATQAIRNSGSLGANTAVDIQAATLDNGGTVNSSRDAVNISSSGQLSNRGQINANQALSLTAAGIDNRKGIE